MSSPDTLVPLETQVSQSRFKNHLALALFLVAITVIYAVWHERVETSTARWDFQGFYVAAEMVAHGEAANLYDLAKQAEYQTRFVDPARTVTAPDLPFVNPAAAAVLFVPFVGLSLANAYIAWTAISLILLLVTSRLLQRELHLMEGELPFFAALMFTPTTVVLIHGQLSIVVLFLMAVAFVLARKGRPYAAGCVLGLACLKFQLVLGLMVILLVRKQWKFLMGAATGAFCIACVSAVVGGWRQLFTYLFFLREITLHPPGGTLAYRMINIRGLLRMLGSGDPALWIVAAISAVLLFAAALAWKDMETGFSIAIIASVLTAYHAYPQDLILLLIPLAVLASRANKDMTNKPVGLLLGILLVSFVLIATPVASLMAIVAAALMIVLSKTPPTAVARPNAASQSAGD
jgi:hypothetical protein